MNLAQIILSMHKAGCSAEQLAAVAADHEEARTRRRCERAIGKALFTPANVATAQSPGSPQLNPDSTFTAEAPQTGAATAAGGTPKAVARAALLMMPGLTPAARRIGARLIEHFNLASGRCCPSVPDMALREGMAERSARRALAELEGLGLIRREIHGAGRSNAYLIAWDQLRGHAAAAENGAATKPDSGATRTLVSGNPDGRVRQNLRRNPDRKTGEGGTRQPDRRQRELPLMSVFTPQQRDVADSAADKRLWADVQGYFQAKLPADRFGAVVGAIPDAAWASGKVAELHRKGSGLQAVLDALHEPVPHAGAPPGQASTG